MKNAFIFLIITVILVAVLMGLFIWKTELLYVVDTVKSPDGAHIMTVLELNVKDPNTEGMAKSVFLRDGWPIYKGELGYLYTEYEGMCWAPDSKKYLLEMTPLERTAIELELVDLEGNCSYHLAEILSNALVHSELPEYGFQIDDRNHPVVAIEFSEWSQDSTAIRFRYEFTDISGEDHCGTFWYRLNEVSYDCVFGIEQVT